MYPEILLCVILAFVIGLLVGKLTRKNRQEGFNAIAGQAVFNNENVTGACQFGVVSPTQLSSYGSGCCAVYHKQNGLYQPVQTFGKCCTHTNSEGTKCLKYDTEDSS